MNKLGKGMSEGTAVVPFGKFKGCAIAEIEDSYLQWLSEQNWFEKKYPNLQEAINDELSYRESYGGKLE